MSGPKLIGLPLEVWGAGILGAVLTEIVNLIGQGTARGQRWWRERRPALVLLERMARAEDVCYVFVRDFFVPQGWEVQVPVGKRTKTVTLSVPLLVRSRAGVIRTVANIERLWSSVESSALSNLFYVFGVAGKNEGVQVVEMSEDTGVWDGNIVVLGAQAERSTEFYKRMGGVAYRMTGKSIIDTGTGQRVSRARGYGYGLILKARNPLRSEGRPGVGLLIGGFGTLGTEAAGYYLRNHYRELARDFGRRTFGVVVRASVESGAASAERLRRYDRATEPKTRFRRGYERVIRWGHRQV